MCRFQSTHPRGVRRHALHLLVTLHRVSIHAPAWGATHRGWLRCGHLRWFQSTHPRGVRPVLGQQHLGYAEFQSTHPRGVRRVAGPTLPSTATVSIHAPAWGATLVCGECGARGPSFNPRTRVGCDRIRGAGADAALAAFQSTHPRGVRRTPASSPAAITRVSIHAPAWGATSPAMCRPWPRSSFNPRTRVGCDRKARVVRPSRWSFQSTHPRGVRLCLRDRQRRVSEFQSTHPRGVRPLDGDDFFVEHGVSIHAPAWGATPAWMPITAPNGSFNPRTRVGCDWRPGTRPATWPGCFNPRTRVGCDGPVRGLVALHVDVSIHAPAWGATNAPACGLHHPVCFNPRTRVGCDHPGFTWGVS